MYGGGGNSAAGFSPAVIASPVATQVGGYLTQLETLHDGFFHLERYTKQKSWGDRFTAYGQTMIRNGGRTGIALTFGFRWLLGGDSKSYKKKKDLVKNTDGARTAIKSLSKA